MALHCMRAPAERRARARRPPGKNKRGRGRHASGLRACLQAAAGWPAAGAIARLAHTRRAAASCLVVARGAANSN